MNKKILMILTLFMIVNTNEVFAAKSNLARLLEREKAQKAEEERIKAEEAKKAEEEKIKAEEAKKAEEEKTKSEEAKKAEEEKTKSEEAKKAEEEKIKAEEAKKAEEEKIKAEEAKKAEEEKIKAEEAKKAEEKNQESEIKPALAELQLQQEKNTTLQNTLDGFISGSNFPQSIQEYINNMNFSTFFSLQDAEKLIRERLKRPVLGNDAWEGLMKALNIDGENITKKDLQKLAEFIKAREKQKTALESLSNDADSYTENKLNLLEFLLKSVDDTIHYVENVENTDIGLIKNKISIFTNHKSDDKLDNSLKPFFDDIDRLLETNNFTNPSSRFEATRIMKKLKQNLISQKEKTQKEQESKTAAREKLVALDRQINRLKEFDTQVKSTYGEQNKLSKKIKKGKYNHKRRKSSW